MQAQFIEKGILDDGLRAAMSAKHSCAVQNGQFPVQVVDSTLDVASYEVWLDWYDLALQPDRTNSGRQCDAHVRLSLTSTIDRMEVKLNTRSLSIDSVKVNGTIADFVADNSMLTITSGMAPGIPAMVDVWYAPMQRRRGLYAFTAHEIDSLGSVPTNLVYTFSEPTDAQYWFPCYDAPHDKAVFTLHARVPDGYVVVSNGVRTDSIPDGDTASWQSWHCPIEMPSYLFSANTSKFMHLDQQVTSVDGRTIELSNYYWPQDHDGQVYNAVRTFEHLPQMITALEGYFGAYPFATYGHVAVAPITIGGMEHQTMTTINRRWLWGDLETAVAHELGHQWSGDHVTCGTWSDIWMNEGGASWSEALWLLSSAGETAYHDNLNAKRTTYFKSAHTEPPVYNPPMSILFNEATTYCKSAWVYHMMYTMCGNQIFDAYKVWFALPPSSRQSWELRDFLKQQIPNPAVSWDVFFDQWLLQPYHPVISAVLVVNDHKQDAMYASTVTLSQIQDLDGFATVFEFPLEIRVADGLSSFDTTIVVHSRETSFTLHLPFAPTSCEIDPKDKVLCQDTVSIVTGVFDESSQPALSVLNANPSVSGQPLRLLVYPDAHVRVFAVTGELLASTVATSDQVVLSTAAWPSGLIEIIVEGGSGFATARHIIVH